MAGRSMTAAEFEQDIAGLADLPRPDLIARWRALYRGNPPKGISRSLLVRAVAYQCIAPGSLDTSLSHAAGLSEIAACHA